jgi:hypothetical protein
VVKRYNVWGMETAEHEAGDFVKYDDVRALRAKYRRALTLLVNASDGAIDINLGLDDQEWAETELQALGGRGGAIMYGYPREQHNMHDYEKIRDLQAQLAQVHERCRLATQLIIADIGATGPENLESALGRLIASRATIKEDLAQAVKEREEWKQRYYQGYHLLEQENIALTQERDRLKARVQELDDRLNRPVLKSEWQQLQADHAALVALVQALPILKGDVVLSFDGTGVSWWIDDTGRERSLGKVLSREFGEAIVALLEARRGMEG